MYKPFETFVLRTPLFPFSNHNQINFDNTIFEEALFLASPDFYDEKKKADNSSLLNLKHKISLYKYYSRACTRSTPFGLFAGCSSGTIGETTEVILDDIWQYRRCTRLDMNYLCSLIQHFEQQSEIKNQLLFFPNDSIYLLGDKIRYVEYYYNKTHRIHRISEVEKSDYLSKILNSAKEGKTVNELSRLIIDDEITIEEATEFVYELIENQLLKSELEVSVSSNDQLDAFISKISKIEGIEMKVEILKKIQLGLKEIDENKIGSTIKQYDNIIDLVQQTKVPYEIKYLFQTDLYKPIIKASVSKEIINDILEALNFLNKITPIPFDTNLDRFKKAFSLRYESQEVPILKALDTELGIGYLQNVDNKDINPLVDDLFITYYTNNKLQMNMDQCQITLLKKYNEINRNLKNPIIHISDSDFPTLHTDWENCHSTLSVMCQILKDNGKDRMIYLSSCGGSCAANLLGRFCHLDDSLYKHTKQITDFEQKMNSDVIYAEIIHLPESRIGNILARPSIRDYEIPYLANSGVDKEHRIPLSDLTISLRKNKILLRSVSHDKEVIPRLTTAHNYASNSLPLYHFLCDLQNQNKRGGFYLNTSGLLDLFKSFPRIVYKNVILSRASWLLIEDEIKGFDKMESELILLNIKALQKTRGIPQFITIPVGDNDLFIDLSDILSIRTFLSIILKNKKIVISEFLYDDTCSVVKNKGYGFCGEFLFSFYNYK
ncbi:MAG: lantibiotic dehydratase family protein [Bacteroidales bacterium]